MATYARKLKDASGNFVVPATRSSCVYMSDDTLLEDYLSSMKSDILKEVEDSILDSHPVGSVYQSSNSTSPASLFGGNWEKIQGRFLLGSSSSHSVTSTGGEEKHTLSIAEMPKHDHSWATNLDSGQSLSWPAWTFYPVDCRQYPNAVKRSQGYTTMTGSGQSHNNMPPYYTVNIWRRTA